MTDRRVAVVTGGGGSGIGAGICSVLAAEGYFVWIADRDAQRAALVADAITSDGGQAQAMALDVADEGAVAAAIERIAVRHGRIDALVNSAGVGLIRPLAEVTAEEFDAVVRVDLRGAWLCSRGVIPHMVTAGRGGIVNIGSIHARAAGPGYGVYAAAKAGLAAMTRSIAVDYGPHGVRCNIIHPGLVDSAQTRELLDTWTDHESWMRQFWESRQALPAPVTPSDIGNAVAFLLSDRASAITGSEIFVDGGSAAMLFDREESDVG